MMVLNPILKSQPSSCTPHPPFHRKSRLLKVWKHVTLFEIIDKLVEKKHCQEKLVKQKVQNAIFGTNYYLPNSFHEFDVPPIINEIKNDPWKIVSSHFLLKIFFSPK